MATLHDDRSTTTDAPLTADEKAVLDFEREWWRYAGAKEQAIREHFDLSATSYYAQLNALIDDERALEYDPMLTKRLRRMRAQRQRQRAANRTDGSGTLTP